MESIWVLTTLGNVTLALLLLYRGWFIRYSWLFASAMLSVGADGMLWYSRINHLDYGHLWRLVFFLCLGVNLAVIFEAHFLRNRRVSIPVELQLLGELVAFLAEKAEFLWVSYYIQCGLRITNLLMIVWFIIVFKGEPSYEP